MEAMISVEKAGVRYLRRAGFMKSEPFWALRDATLQIWRGESIGVVGRNGAGKTTLLQLIAGIIAPDRGRVLNPGHSASLLQLQLGFLPHLTGRQNARLSGMLLGLDRREVDARMSAIVEFSGLGDFIEQPVGSYSSGMKARLGFSVAFQIDPDVLLIDEVLSVGDAEFREKSETAIRQKVRSNKTVVLATHNARTISELCDRAVWLEEGETKADGAPAVVLADYDAFWRARKPAGASVR